MQSVQSLFSAAICFRGSKSPQSVFVTCLGASGVGFHANGGGLEGAIMLPSIRATSGCTCLSKDGGLYRRDRRSHGNARQCDYYIIAWFEIDSGGFSVRGQYLSRSAEVEVFVSCDSETHIGWDQRKCRCGTVPEPSAVKSLVL